MNIQVTVTKQDIISNQASFPTMEEAQKWASSHEQMGSFGRCSSSYEERTEISPASSREEQREVSPAQFDEQGVETAPAQFTTVIIETPAVYQTNVVQVPAEYEITIIDVTAQLLQDKVNKESLEYLAKTDWYILREMDSNIPCPAEIKEARQAARDSIV